MKIRKTLSAAVLSAILVTLGGCPDAAPPAPAPEPRLSGLALSAGTLAISLTFVKDVIRTPRPGSVIFLALAWTALAVSIVAILISMLTSQWALRKTIEQVDRGQERQLRAEPGGWRSRLTAALNVSAAVGFVLGVALLAWFAIANIGAVGTAPHP